MSFDCHGMQVWSCQYAPLSASLFHLLLATRVQNGSIKSVAFWLPCLEHEELFTHFFTLWRMDKDLLKKLKEVFIDGGVLSSLRPDGNSPGECLIS